MKPTPAQPKPGQESVWAYPRPPRLEVASKRLRVVFGGVTIADTRRGFRVLETSHPPVYYFPPADIRVTHLSDAGGGSVCEWKGAARYFDIEAGGRSAPRAAWCYPRPTPRFEAIRGYVAFYGQLMDECHVGIQRARPQAGRFYGGWITDDIVGPFKGEPGTVGW